MASESDGSFKGFNRTGDEKTADVILRPKADPALLLKRGIMLAIVLILLGAIGAYALSRSHLSLTGGEQGHGLAAPEQQVD